MHPDLKALIRLQEVDLAIQQLRAKTDAFPALSKALDEKLASAQNGVTRAREAIKTNQARRKELESHVADLEAKIAKYKNQLMSVKTNEEYKAMVKEIEYNQKAIGTEEDNILALMEESEALDAQLKAAEDRLREDEKAVEAERRTLEESNAVDVRALNAYIEERTASEKNISDDTLFRYERIRKARGGVAMARASDEACEVCNVRMRPQIFQEVRKNSEIITCDSCARILYDPKNLDHPFEVA